MRNSSFKILFLFSSLILSLVACDSFKPAHSHDYIKHSRIEPTCEMSGNIEYYECGCGKLFVFVDNKYKEVEESETILKELGHNVVVNEGIPETCTKDGLSEGSHCSRCGKIITEQITIKAHGHAIIDKQESAIPHFEYTCCDECDEIFDYKMPIIDISCDGEPSEDYLNCKVSTHDSFANHCFSGVDAQFKIRGNWTTNLPKKPYRIKFSKKQSMFGLNNDLKAKSWVLLADYADKSMIRNATAFYIANQLFGEDYYSSDCCFVELNINNEFQGIYLLAEQQQVGKGRVDIYEDKNNESNQIGYLMEYDQYYWKEDPSTVFEIDYNQIPYLNGYIADDESFIKQYVIKSDIVNESQRAFIEDRIQKIWDVSYDALFGDHNNQTINPYKTIDNNGDIVDDFNIKDSYDAINRIIDINSLVDTYLFNEIVQNMDIGYSSFYMSLDMSEKGSQKLTFQAPWDFDWAFSNSINNIHELFLGNYLPQEPNHEKSNPWLLLFSNEQWLWKMMQSKWNELNNHNLRENIVLLIERFTDNYSDYIQKESEKWEDKNNIVVWCSSENALAAMNQKDDAANVIFYINRRFEWLSYYFEDLTRIKSSFVSD